MMSRKFVRQSFLGPSSHTVLSDAKVGIVGLGGGGCYISQELAHVGVGHFELFDFDRFSMSNLNRGMGATLAIARARLSKISVYANIIRAINPHAEIVTHRKKWQSCAESLRECDAVFGCVDSFLGRKELEIGCRRYLIPYIDIGMDVVKSEGGFAIGGQIVTSMPGGPCMHCVGFLTDELLAKEASKYGEAGGRPQVVWPNGVLASTAVGIFVQLMTPWCDRELPLFHEYDGNSHTVNPSSVLNFYRGKICPHFTGSDDLGDPFFK